MTAKPHAPQEVTLLIGALLGGGAESVCLSIANGLAARGWAVTLLVLNENASVYHDRIDDAVNYVVLGCNSAQQAALPLRRWLRANRPSKVVVFNHGLAALLVAVRFASRVDFHIIARNINTLSQKINARTGLVRRQVIHPLMFGLYRRVDFVVNQCQGMQSDLVGMFPDLVGKTCVIYNPINAAVTQRLAGSNMAQLEESDAADRERYILCVGRLNEQKAFAVAIRAFAEIAPRYPQLRLRFLGQGPLESELRQLAIELELAERIDFMGFKAGIWDDYLRAELTLLTSAYEGFPNVLLESIALGTPIVAVDCPSGPAEIVQPGVNGLLVRRPATDSNQVREQALESELEPELGQALAQVLDSTEYTRERVQKTAESFRLNTILDTWEDLLKSSRFS